MPSGSFGRCLSVGRAGAVGQSRSSQRVQVDDEEEKRLVQEMLALVGQHPAMAIDDLGLLRKAGWTVNPQTDHNGMA